MPREYQAKVYTLDDGTKITAKELADKTGLRLGLATNRLARTTDPTRVFAKKGFTPARKYELDDGSKYSVNEIMEITGVAANTVRGRLAKSRDPKYVLAAKKGDWGSTRKKAKIPKLLSDRMAFDQRSDWVLIMKNT